MTELLPGHSTIELLLTDEFSREITALGFILPEELLNEQAVVASESYITLEEHYDAISLHLDHCGYFYKHSEAIQNSDRRLEVNQGLLLYAAQRWYEAKNYADCLRTLHVLHEDIIHSNALEHLHIVTDLIVAITDEYSAAVFARTNSITS